MAWLVLTPSGSSCHQLQSHFQAVRGWLLVPHAEDQQSSRDAGAHLASCLREWQGSALAPKGS